MKQRERARAPTRWSAPLPVDEVIPELRRALVERGGAVLQAPPGAGKTTHVPLALMDEPWLGGSKVVMLEPRRLATRAVTHRMAQLLGERAGDTVGYRIRGDTRAGPGTRIEVVTEGILTRMLQSDPTLEGIGLLIFDEFHERSVHADTGLALALHSRSLVRPDLRILVMSATLDGGRVAAFLGDVPVITSAGRMYPVELVYSARPEVRALASVTASKVLKALREDRGDVLVFLPGGGEIRRVSALLDGHVPDNVRVDALYGDMPQQAQDAAIGPAEDGVRKVVLATPIAETSLTIPGVGVVIDSGLARAPRFSPRSGMTRLETVRVSMSSAEQRAGRAGRIGPGKAYRLWPEQEQNHLRAHALPEILQADLAALALELAVAGIPNPTDLHWLDRPPVAAWKQGTELLQMLGAVTAAGSVTAHGTAMAALPAHPRIAHMLITARTMGAAALACDIAAILAERDFVHGRNGPADADIEIRLQLLRRPKAHSVPGADVDLPLVHKVASESDELMRRLGVSRASRSAREPGDSIGTGSVIALAYPDRVGQARGGTSDGRFLLRNGRGAQLTHPQSLSAAQYIVAAELAGDAKSARIFLAASLTRDDVETHFADQFTSDTFVEWDDAKRNVRAVERVMLGAIVLAESMARTSEATVSVLLDVVRREGIGTLPWSERARAIRERIAFMRLHHAEWPDVSDEALLATLDEWLAPLLADRTSLAGTSSSLDEALMSMLDWQQRAELDRLAPQYYVAPTGSRATIDYSDPLAPIVGVRLQEMFGVTQTPTIDAGRVPLTLQLLSPARRPVQVTRDLAGFWSGSYFEVRKELRGRYPKHVWPEDPLSATPTPRAKRRGE